jgi:hypothetical protein
VEQAIEHTQYIKNPTVGAGAGYALLMFVKYFKLKQSLDVLEVLVNGTIEEMRLRYQTVFICVMLARRSIYSLFR